MSEQNECETEGHPIQNETFYSEENLHARLMKKISYIPSMSLCSHANFQGDKYLQFVLLGNI